MINILSEKLVNAIMSTNKKKLKCFFAIYEVLNIL